MARTMVEGRTYCLQVSVDAARWPDEMLSSFTRGDEPISPAEVRDELHRLKAAGCVVLPCEHECNELGECLGVDGNATAR